MDGKFAFWLKITLASLMLISVIFLAMVLSQSEGTEGLSNWVSNAIVWSMILIGATVVAVFAVAAKDMMNDISVLYRFLMALGILGVVALISYLLATDEIPVQPTGELADITAGVARYSETAIWMTYILAGGAIIASFYSSIVNIFK